MLKTNQNVEEMRKEVRAIANAVLNEEEKAELRDIKMLLKEHSRSVELVSSPSKPPE